MGRKLETKNIASLQDEKSHLEQVIGTATRRLSVVTQEIKAIEEAAKGKEPEKEAPKVAPAKKKASTAKPKAKK